MKFIFLLITVLSLVGCASTTIKSSTLEDISLPLNYNAGGKSVYLIYKGVRRYHNNVDNYDSQLQMRRLKEIEELLKSKGFVINNNKSSDLILKINEERDTTDASGKPTLGNISMFLVSSLSLSIVPFKLESVYNFNYEVTKSNGEIVGKINNKIEVRELKTLMSSDTEEDYKKARLTAHEQALAELIDQGVL